jgi:hypothetical protein
LEKDDENYYKQSHRENQSAKLHKKMLCARQQAFLHAKEISRETLNCGKSAHKTKDHAAKI